MALTSIADVWNPEIWIPAIEEKQATFPSLINSGVVVRSDEFNSLASGAGSEVNMPVWLDSSDQADDIQVEDTAPTPQKITTGTMKAPVLNRVWAASKSALSSTVAGEDSVPQMVNKLAERRLKQRQTTMVNILNALFGSGGPLEDLDYDISIAAGESAASANLISTSVILNATAALGEREGDLESGAIFVHPMILAALRIQDENSFERDSSGPFTITRWKGIPLYTSNSLAVAGGTNGFVYSTYLIANGAFARGEAPQAGDVIDTASLQYDEDKGKNNWTVYDRTRFLLHPNFQKFDGSVAGQSATNAELAVAAGWTSVATSIDRCGMVRIRTNG